MKSGGNLERVLTEGHFAVTTEIGPPKGGSADFVRKTAAYVKDCCDAMNVTDNQTAIVRMSSLAACAILRQLGIDAVMQMVTRDRNRLAMQSDILGAVALDIHNLLCLTGDHQKFGNHPTAKNVHDIDSIQLAQMAKTMRDEGVFISGDKISGDVPLFIGCAANPFADPFEFRVLRLAKKINAGTDFIQTQAVFDVPRFAKWMEMVYEQGLHRRAHILAGIIPMKSAGMARYMKKYVAGLMIPDELVKRMEQASDAKEEGVSIACELIEQIREIPGVRGIHIMAVAWEEIVPEIVERVGLLPRPIV
jgi:methylenetetrahydrofolate reductase (NADPH)